MNHAGRSLGEVSGGNRSVSKYAEFKRKSAHLCMACVFCFAKGSRTEVKMNGEAKRTRLDQRRAPIHEALENFRRMRVVPFDVPGHKRGRGNPELTAFLGQQCVGVDVNSMKPLDNLCHPVSVIREAEELAADAFGAAHAFLMVGGTTSSVQSMVLTACKRGDEIILPRNVHRSVLNALVLCGAGFGLFQSPNNHLLLSSAPSYRTGGASGMQATARLVGQTTGAALVALLFYLNGDRAPHAAMWLAGGFTLCGSLVSCSRLRAHRF